MPDKNLRSQKAGVSNAVRPFLVGDFFFEVINRAFFVFKLVKTP